MKFVANFDDAVKVMGNMDADIDHLFKVAKSHNKDLTKIITAHNELAKLVEVIRKKHNWLNFVVAGYALVALIKFCNVDIKINDLKNRMDAMNNTDVEDVNKEEE